MTKSKKLIAAIDADGVLLNFLMAWETAAKVALRRKIKQISNTYELSERYDVTVAENDRIWAEFHNGNYWRHIPALVGAAAAVKQLVELDLEIHIVTAIPQHLMFERIYNLHKADIHFDKVHCVPKSKLDKLIELKPVVFFDDNHDHIESAMFANVPHRILIPNSPEEGFSDHATHIAPSIERAVQHLVSIDFLNQEAPVKHRARSL